MSGRHARDEDESLTEKVTGPFRRVRRDADTEPADTVNPNETKRRAWPVALLLGIGLAAAVGIPAGLISANGDDPPTRFDTAGRSSLSASPVPGPTVTETVTKTIKAGKPVPVPTKTVYRPTPVPGPTIYQSGRPAPTITETVQQAVPGPTKTKTVKEPVPGPTVTETVRIRVRVCFGAWANGNYERIQCP